MFFTVRRPGKISTADEVSEIIVQFSDVHIDNGVTFLIDHSLQQHYFD